MYEGAPWQRAESSKGLRAQIVGLTARLLPPMMEPVEKVLPILCGNRLFHLPGNRADPQQLGHC